MGFSTARLAVGVANRLAKAIFGIDAQTNAEGTHDVVTRRDKPTRARRHAQAAGRQRSPFAATYVPPRCGPMPDSRARRHEQRMDFYRHGDPAERRSGSRRGNTSDWERTRAIRRLLSAQASPPTDIGVIVCAR